CPFTATQATKEEKKNCSPRVLHLSLSLSLSLSPSLSTYCSHSIPFSLLLSLLPSPSILPSLSLSPFLTGVIFQRLFPLCQSHRCSVLLHSGSHTSVCVCV